MALTHMGLIVYKFKKLNICWSFVHVIKVFLQDQVGRVQICLLSSHKHDSNTGYV